MLENAVMIGRNIIEENKDQVLPTFAYSVLDNYIAGDIVSDEGSLLIGTNSGIYVAVGDEQNDHFSDLLVQTFMQRKILTRDSLYSLRPRHGMTELMNYSREN